jgi:hypothetical protein
VIKNKEQKEVANMKLFIVHVNLGCCANNSDGKVFVTADTEEQAREIVDNNTIHPITMIETFDLNNEIVYSSFKVEKQYRFEHETDNWGYLPEQYVIDHNMDKRWLQSWHLSHQY